MSIQNNELMTTTGNRFILPQAVETTFTAEELAEDMDGIQLNFRQVKVPAGGTLQYEIPTEDPDVPDYRTVFCDLCRSPLALHAKGLAGGGGKTLPHNGD